MTSKRIARPPEGTQAAAKSKYSELHDIDPNANNGLQNASGSFVAKLLGDPTSDKIKPLIKLADVGPFKAEGFKFAVESLKLIMSEVEVKYPELYSRITNDGMRVVRKIKGSSSPSFHSWGIAIDIRVDKIKDVRFNDKALYGLTLLAPIFHKHGWYWGGAFRDKQKEKGVYWSNEDAMHFEVSKNKLLEWQNTGLLKSLIPAKLPPALAVPKPSTSKKKVNKKAENGLKHPLAAETSAWHQKDHYNTKRWNIASRLYSLHRFLRED